MPNQYYHLFLFLFISILFVNCNSSKSASNVIDSQTTHVYLVRHAEKADDGTRNPPLSPIGQERAQRLAKELKGAPIAAIFSTPYKRTEETVQPLADKLKLTIQSYDPFDTTFLMQAIAEHKGKAILIVGHSNTIPNQVNYLLNQEKYAQLDEKDYDKLFQLAVKGEEVELLREVY